MSPPASTPPPPEELSAEPLLRALNALLPSGRVPSGIFGHDGLHRGELRAIFARCWVFLAHESEIEHQGDFVRRKIGEDDFIVVRNDRGEVSVFFDACRHRGVQICRADAGRTTRFRCPYHGWTYDTNGCLVGVPAWKAAFEGMSKRDNGLLPVAQVASRHGFIFATLDPRAPGLDEYLGGMSWYLDLVFGLNEHGVEVLAPPQRFILDANWKSPAENFAGDDYHLATLHRSVWEIGAFPVPVEDDMTGYHVHAAPGHSLSLSVAPDGADPGPEFYGTPPDVAATFGPQRITAQQVELARRCRVLVGNVFPNFSVLAQPATEDAGSHPPTGVLTFRVWQPLGPGRLEAWNWFCAYRNATAEQKRRSYAAGLGTVSLGGCFEMDDAEPWISASRNARSVAADVLDLQLNYQMGMPGVGHTRRAPEWPGPGFAFTPRYEEGVQRNFLRFYARMMSSPSAWPKFTPCLEEEA
jgi:phenylpropionate dioxygenase-like ring-hydroxylating dioxygenase large terminal subunit